MRIHFNSGDVYSKTSSAAVPHLINHDNSANAFGILFHNEQFVFGITDYIYDYELEGNAGFLMSLEHNRLSNFYAEEYSVDSQVVF